MRNTQHRREVRVLLFSRVLGLTLSNSRAFLKSLNCLGIGNGQQQSNLTLYLGFFVVRRVGWTVRISSLSVRRGGKVQNFFGITGEMLAMGHVETQCDILRSVTRVFSVRSDVYEIG